MFIDIDDFKNINDTYGHGVGDEYLIEFANRLKALPIENTIQLRIAGDEFGLFSYGLTEIDEDYKQNYWKIITENILNKPFEIKGEQLTFAFSGGIAVYGRDTDEIYELIEFADSAMYEAKRSGKNKMASYKKIK
jgi:diguanylate cyclase (GGDEF)-like protein